MREDSSNPLVGVENEAAQRVGVLAGAGRFPAEAAGHFRAAGYAVIAVGFNGITAPDLEDEVDSMHWLDLGQFEAAARALEGAQVSRVLLLGKIPKSLLISGEAKLSPDAEAIALLAALGDRSDEGLLAMIAQWLEGKGFVLLDQGVALAEMLVPPGPLTDSLPGKRAEADLVAGWPVLEALGRCGVGQCVVVKDGAVLAVEAIEGTDETIRRAGQFGGAGATVIKALRTVQDRRFDLPAIGPETIEAMVEAGCTALAVEARTTLILERERCVAEADRAGIAIWGFDSGRGRTVGAVGAGP
jgi:UDP-2,3-diacylglucosamine hydrolase